MHRRITPLLAASLLLMVAGGAVDASSPRAQQKANQPRILHAQKAVPHGSTKAAPARRVEHPFLTAKPAAYARAKARANAQVARTAGSAARGADLATRARLPFVSTSWQGLKDVESTPSDSTGAVGRTRYIEMVNTQVGIYTRGGSLVGAQIDLNTFTGSGAADSVFDPQVIWDGQQNRFFYVADQIVDATDHRLAFGWSMTASPSSEADFCRYNVSFGANFPDYPKLGDSQDFMLIGYNLFSADDSFLSSGVAAITKPPLGAICPDASTLLINLSGALLDETGLPTNLSFTPVPAQQTDTSATGWVVASSFDPSLGATSLYLYPVTRDPLTGFAVLPVIGTRVPVPTYFYPSGAAQRGASQLLDTSDTRLTQAVSAFDPRLGREAIWTQHTVWTSTNRSGVRWYEIDPLLARTFQRGIVTFPGGWAFNGAISPDRQVSGLAARYGSNMVLTYSTSSSTTNSRIYVRSKVGAGFVSPATLIVASTGPMVDFSCLSAGSTCRWGDYAAATPDPVRAGRFATAGRVWITNQWNAPKLANPSTGSVWRTWNAAVLP